MGLSQGTASILVVCTGNVCRSPYLEYLLRDRLDRVWGPGHFEVSSAGVRGLHGESMTPHSADLLAQEGIDGGDFRARRLMAGHLTSADLVICATRTHRSSAVQLAPAVLRRAVLLPELALALGHTPAWSASQNSTHGPAGDGEMSQWVRSVARAVVNHRPAVVGTVEAADLDIDDPYGGPQSEYALMARRMGRWLPDAVKVLSPAS
ncbi:MAG: hypothetical protein WBG57_09915 [Ornithinimicrobium sp.]